MSASARREARLLAVQYLFQREFHPEAGDTAADFDAFVAEAKAPAKVADFARVLARGAAAHRADSDQRLALLSENWDLKRIGLVEKSILRLALFELFHREDIPPVVTVNEAVELAKELSSDESGKFVNGLLDRVLKTLNRPLRAPAGKAARKRHQPPKES